MAEDQRELILATLSRVFAAWAPERADELLRAAEIRMPSELVFTLECGHQCGITPYVVRVTPEADARRWKARWVSGAMPGSLSRIESASSSNFRASAEAALKAAGGDGERLAPTILSRLADGARFVAACPNDGSGASYRAVLTPDGWRAVGVPFNE